MKYFKLFLGILFFTIFLNSCSSEDSKETTSNSFSLVGEWSNYKQSRLKLNVADEKPVVTLCGTTGAKFECGVAVTYLADGTGKVSSDGSTFTYSYTGGVYKVNGKESELKEISSTEYSVVLKATQNGIQYETTYFYKK